MSTVTFYNYPIAFNPAKPKFALEEHGIKYTEKKIDIFTGQSLEPWYLKINPNGSAPSLVAGETVITESAEIVKWTDEQEGGPLGGDKVDRTFISEWIPKVDAWDGNLFVAAFGTLGGVLTTVAQHKIKVAEAYAKKYPDLSELYNKKVAAMKASIDGPISQETAEANKAQLVALLDEAEERLGKTKFVAGDEISIADAMIVPCIYRIFVVKLEKDLYEPRPNLKRYYTEIKKRPSYKKTFAVAESKASTGGLLLPAFLKIYYKKVTGKY